MVDHLDLFFQHRDAPSEPVMFSNLTREFVNLGVRDGLMLFHLRLDLRVRDLRTLLKVGVQLLVLPNRREDDTEQGQDTDDDRIAHLRRPLSTISAASSRVQGIIGLVPSVMPSLTAASSCSPAFQLTGSGCVAR